jgi:transposase
MEHKAGDKAFIDYAGDTVPIYCRKTKTVLFNAQLFIMVLGASQYTFAYASESQSLPNWIAAHARAFEFFGGVPRVLVPDNLKSAVTDSCKFEPLANLAYADMAAHYGTVIIPARPYTPKDKASAENAVLIVERRVMARLSKQRFYSLAALNRAIEELMKAINHRPFQKRQGSRYTQFQEQEAHALRALPVARYEFAQLKYLTVPPDYHLRLDGHYYSVPYTLVGQQVFCRTTTTTIEVLYQNQRVASHPKSYEKDKKSSCPEHMPRAHRQFIEWTPEGFLVWAQNTGSAVHHLAREIIANKPHLEQCSKFHEGLKNLSRRFGGARLNRACQRALALGCIEFKSIRSILEKNLDQVPYLSAVSATFIPPHSNLRGPGYYQH